MGEMHQDAMNEAETGWVNSIETEQHSVGLSNRAPNSISVSPPFSIGFFQPHW
jgi:hypothetical protein